MKHMIKAVIFDLDGVISDTNKLHASIEASLLKENGINVKPDELMKNYAGLSDKEFFKKILKDYGISGDADTLYKEKWERMMPIAANNILPIPGAIKIINDLKERGLKIGISSASPLKFIELVLSKLGLKEKFDAITSGEEVKYGKPNPEIFSLTAKKLKVNSQECLVIEDSDNGMTAAKKAGMKCIGLVKEEAKKHPADLILTTLENLTVEKIINL